MPVDKSLDAVLNESGITLDELDKKATKAVKTLEQETKKLREAKKELGKKDRPTPSDKAADITKDDTPSKKTEKEKISFRDALAEQAGGGRGARTIFAFGKNPKNFILGISKTIPFLGGVFAAKEIADFIIDEIVKLDKFLKAFIDEIDKRLDPFRSLLEQAFVVAGLSQRIITTASGSTEPRYAYNTFEEFNTNQADLEERFQMTNNSGVE